MKASKAIYGLPVFFLLTLSYLAVDLELTLEHLKHVEEVRYNSYLAADELRQSSQDLTRLARTFVMTKDPSYEKKYWDILAWRGGKVPRPSTFALHPSKVISLNKIMKELGFTDEEFALLDQSAKNSDGLVKTETIAMNAIKGFNIDGRTPYSGKEAPEALARRIMFDNQYHADVAKIMAPIDQFFRQLDARSKGAVQTDSDHADFLSAAIFTNIILLSIAIVLVVVITQKTLKTAITQVVNRLNASVTKLLSASSELSRASGTLSQGTTDQASSVEETSASLEEISAMVKNNVSNSEKSVELTESVKKKSQQGNESMDLLKEAMKNILESNERIEELVKVIGNIAEKTEIMDEIVLQTKLLSFNASVEAERAGEHGRGFAVVAKEVGNLARLSGVAAEEIAVIVKDSLTSAAEITGKNKEHVEQGDSYVRETASMLSDILSSVTQVTAGSQQIMVASKEQSEGIGQINIAIDRISRNTQTTSTIATDTSSSAEILEAEVETLNRTIHELAAIIGGKTDEAPVAAPKASHGPSAKVTPITAAKPKATKPSQAAGGQTPPLPKASGEWESL